MHAWKTGILDRLQADSLKVTNGLFDVINAQRAGKETDSILVKRVVDSFRFLGEHLEPDNRHHIYEDNFEARYLEDLAEYFKHTLGIPSLQEAKNDKYRKMVEDLLEQEAAKVGNCLPITTQSKGASRVGLE